MMQHSGKVKAWSCQVLDCQGWGGGWKKKIDCKSASGAVSLQIFFPTLHIQLFFFFFSTTLSPSQQKVRGLLSRNA